MSQSRKNLLLVSLVVAGAVLVIAASVTAWRVSRVLSTARQEVRSEGSFSFVSRPYAAPSSSLFQVVRAPAVFRQATKFQDHLFIAGPVWLFDFYTNVALLHSFSPGAELPPSPLIALAPMVLGDSREAELVVATEQDGLLAYNGRSFRQILPRETEARALTAILPVAAGHLLMGTKRRGVLLFDGQQIVALHPSLAGLYVTKLAGDEAELGIGTLDHGVLHWHGGTVEGFSEEQGLPDRQVQSLAIVGHQVFVGTAAGVAEFDGGRVSRVVAKGLLAT